MSSDSGTSAGTILGAILFVGYVHDANKDIFPSLQTILPASCNPLR